MTKDKEVKITVTWLYYFKIVSLTMENFSLFTVFKNFWQNFGLCYISEFSDS